MHQQLTDYDNYRTNRESLKKQISTNNSPWTKIKTAIGIKHDDGTLYDENGNAKTAEQQLDELEREYHSSTNGVIKGFNIVNNGKTYNMTYPKIQNDSQFEKSKMDYRALEKANLTEAEDNREHQYEKVYLWNIRWSDKDLRKFDYQLPQHDVIYVDFEKGNEQSMKDEIGEVYYASFMCEPKSFQYRFL